jgi:beta-1,4-mannosyltransferase
MKTLKEKPPAADGSPVGGMEGSISGQIEPVQPRARVRVLHYPHGRANPYQRLMVQALGEQGLEVRLEKGCGELLRAALGRRFDILHLHWISGSILGSSVPGTLIKSAKFIATLLFFRFRGTRIFWTIHNLQRHERKQERLERALSVLIARLADKVLVHGDSAVSTVRRFLRIDPGRVLVLPHGNYEGHPRPEKTRVELREEIGASPGVPIFLFFGMIRPYKGVPELIRAFHAVPGQAKLLIAGSIRRDQIAAELREIAACDPRVEIRPGYLPEEELAGLLEAADCVVLPYRDVFSSGSVLLALTFSRPVIAPKIGLIPDYVDESCGILYDPQNPFGLQNALKSALSTDALERMAAGAGGRAREFDWSGIAARLAGAYREALAPTGAPKARTAPTV